MSNYIEDECETTLQLKLREIKLKAERKVRLDKTTENEDTEVEESSFGEILKHVNHPENDSLNSDAVRDSIVKHLVESDYEEELVD